MGLIDVATGGRVCVRHVRAGDDQQGDALLRVHQRGADLQEGHRHGAPTGTQPHIHPNLLNHGLPISIFANSVTHQGRPLCVPRCCTACATRRPASSSRCASTRTRAPAPRSKSCSTTSSSDSTTKTTRRYGDTRHHPASFNPTPSRFARHAPDDHFDFSVSVLISPCLSPSAAGDRGPTPGL